MALAGLSGRLRGPRSRAYRRRRTRSGFGEEGGSGAEAPSPEERRIRRRRYWSIGIGTFLILVIFGVVGFGYYWEFFRPPRVWAGSVNNIEFTMGDLVQRIRVLQGVNRYEGGRVNLSTVPFEYLQELVNVEILRQAAPGLGINPSDEAIEGEVRRRFTPTVPEGQEVDPGQLDQEFRNNYQTFLTATGLTDGEYRVIVGEEITDFGLFLLMGQEIESPQTHVEVRWIRLPIDPGQAGAEALLPDQVAERLEVEPFETVAREVNQSEGYSDPTGYVGWVPKGAFPEVDPLLYGDQEGGTAALTPGQVSRPHYASDGIFIVEMLSGPEEQEVSERMRVKLALELADEWKNQALREGTADGTVRLHFDSNLYAWVAKQVSVTAPRVDVTGQSGQPAVGR